MKKKNRKNLIKSYKKERKKETNSKNKLGLKKNDVVGEEVDVATILLEMELYDDKFRKYHVPKRFQEQMMEEQPLKPYLERLEEFMKIAWRKEAEKNRDKKQRTLIEWMEKLNQSNEEEKIAFDALKTAFSEIGIQISKFLIEYFFLIFEVSDESKEILALSLYEVKSVLKCLNVEKNSNSIVINTFLSMVQLFEGAMTLVGPCWEDVKEWEIKEGTDEEKVMFFIDNRKDDLLYLIIKEVLRLEVSFCSPDLPMKVINDVFYSMAKHLVDNVFEDKLNRVAAKIDGMKLDIHFVQDEDSSETKYFRQVLEAGVKELWTKSDPKARSITKLVLL